MPDTFPSSRETCTISYIKPSIENVVPFAVFKKTQPRTLTEMVHGGGIPGSFTDDDNINHAALLHMDQSILYGGGRDFILQLLNNDSPDQKLESVDLFILNSCVILWFDILGHGLRIPYTSVLYHAVRNNGTHADGHSLQILLTLERDDTLDQFFPATRNPGMPLGVVGIPSVIDSVELLLYPKYSMYERHYNSQMETLFTFGNFGMNRGDDMISNCNESLAMGMELHMDDFHGGEDNDMANATNNNFHNNNNIADPTAEEGASFTGISDFLQHTTFHNSGLADDLDNDTYMNHVVNRNSTEAGMALQFHADDKTAGRKNPRQH